jgi:DNA replication protein DnaC
VRTVLDLVHESIVAHGGKFVPISTDELYAANRFSREEIEEERARVEAERIRAEGKKYEGTEQAREDASIMRMQMAGVPERYRHVTSDQRRNAELKDGKNAYIFGGSQYGGSGKTTLACQMLRGWMDAGMGSGKFVPSVDLIAAAMPGGDDNLVSSCMTCGLLVLDDLGKETHSQYANAALFRVIDARYSNKRPTIVTSQLDPSAMARKIAECGDSETAGAIVSRLVYGAIRIDTGNANYRREGN